MYNILEPSRKQYFQKVAELVPHFNGQFIVLTHLLPDRPELLNAIRSIAPIAMVVAIPYSTNLATLHRLQIEYHVATPTLDELRNPLYINELLTKINAHKELIILEIGGYFASTLPTLYERLQGKLIGVVESTEAGHRQYERIQNLPCPVISVSRGSLKRSEYSLVGSSCLFSTERLVRRAGFILDGKNAAVLGYGKVGNGLARSLMRYHCKSYIYDTNPILRLLAISEGYQAPEKDVVLAQAEIIFGATGNQSIAATDFAKIRHGALLVSCSSKDIEFDLNFLNKNYQREELFDNFDLYHNDHQYFYLLGKGMPINFLDNAVMGPILALVQAEVIYGIKRVMDLKGERGIFEIAEEDRKTLALMWLKYFNDNTLGYQHNEHRSHSANQKLHKELATAG